MRDLISLLTMSTVKNLMSKSSQQNTPDEKLVGCSQRIQVVDLFAGPGGLGEGFSSSGDGKHFEIVVSAEKDTVARETLRLRAFFRLLKNENPDRLHDYYNYCNGNAVQPYTDASEAQWEKADQEARCITLGTEEGNAALDATLDARLDQRRPWVLIGGPPCQAYSLVGRARNKGKTEYSAENDHRHFLYKEYLRIIKERRPAVFVMENVKGILSSKVGGEGIFNQILQDLADPNTALKDPAPGIKYRICSLVSDQAFQSGDDIEMLDSRGFIIRAERHGIPQARHRVILLGIALDQDGNVPEYNWLHEVHQPPTVGQVVGDLPKLRSRLTKQLDNAEIWCRTVSGHLGELYGEIDQVENPRLAAEMAIVLKQLVSAPIDTGGVRVKRFQDDGRTGNVELDAWLRDEKLNYWLNHDARGHMSSDLRRYVYAGVFAKALGTSPKGHQQFLLSGLAPAHKNWDSGKFSDRFRVQVEPQPSTTITSHISKDGHYFIHYDPQQCRSLTVREAARLQTFPDNYFFQGNRTEQFHQVGNAVPPLLANKIAAVVYGVVRSKTHAVSPSILTH
jgi:DNA (cytosine-5)-methyltransferase 1